MNLILHPRVIHGRLLSAVLALAVTGATSAAARAANKVPDFSLLDLTGQNHDLHRAEGRAVVLFFTGVGCPIARKSAPKLTELHDRFARAGVSFWIIDTYPSDTPKEIFKEISELKLLEAEKNLSGFAYLRDPRQGVAVALGVERTAEVVAISTSDWRAFYQGAIDDQFIEGGERPAAQNHFLESALNEFLAGQMVKQPRTAAHGCRLSFASVAEGESVPSYGQQVAPVLRSHCVECHRTGAIAPWAMDSYDSVMNYSRMIEEVVLTRRMPPWDPDPDFGHFAKANRLSREELQTLLRWVEAGAPRGDGADPLQQPLPPVPEWELGKPDVVLQLHEVQHIPATGVLDYRLLPVDLALTNDAWISGIEIKPGNRKVVHHAILYGKWPDSPNNGNPNGVFLAGWAPGVPPLHYPAGVGKRLPVGAELNLELHYTTCGSEQTDQTRVALYFWPEPQPRVAETRAAAEWNLNLPPGSDDVRNVATYAFTRPATIYGLSPHMHFRGNRMRYDLLLPNGKMETLLNVPRYDFNWQFGYQFIEPRHVPAGAWLLVTGAFDNSEGKPGNPDATQRIHAGKQSWDEMFIGFFEAADDPAVAPVVNGGARQTAQNSISHN